MNYKNELEYTMNILRKMQIDSHIIKQSQLSDDTEKMYMKLLKITGKSTINLVTDETMNNYAVFQLPEKDEQSIFFCGPFAESEALSAVFSALGEVIWGSADNFTIKKHIITDGVLTETEKDFGLLKYSVHVQEAITIIETDLTADLSLKTVSGLLGINASYFSTLFRKETGNTFTSYVNMKRIEQAKKLLSSTSLQIQTVAQHCGILDVNYFTKLFRKHTGTTPGKFRTKS